MSIIQASTPRLYEFKALSDVWTGDIAVSSQRLITTGLLGSIRWWFEVLVRGFGGAACDPTTKSERCQNREHCVVCEFFGCTGWARKFRFDVLQSNGAMQKNQIKNGKRFQLRFTPLRPICEEEWMLLDLTLRLIANYGALGGKTVYKPSNEQGRKDKPHHSDFGLIELIRKPKNGSADKSKIETYASRRNCSEQSKFKWASLKHFWFVEGRTLARQSPSESSFNRVLGRNESKSGAQNLESPQDRSTQWLAGGTGVSKKVFSFQQPARTFGFVKPPTPTHDDMFKRLKRVWPDLQAEQYIRGPAIVDALVGTAGVSQ